MLVRITNKCLMGCSHCLVNSTPEGAHMHADTWARVLDFIVATRIPIVLVSGGEPTEHPELFSFIREAQAKGLSAFLLSNGSFLANRDLTEALIRCKAKVQITNDPRFYPRGLDENALADFLRRSSGSDIMREIRVLSVQGRARKLAGVAIQPRTSPQCFNLRSLARSMNGFTPVIAALRDNLKFCTPSIDIDGGIRAGESTECLRIGTVTDSMATLMNVLCSMRCNACGLEDSLPLYFRRAIIDG